MWSRQPTCGGVVCPGIEYNINISVVHHSIVPDLVFLISLGIKDYDAQVPHNTYCVQHHLIPPDLLVQEVPTVRLVGQWTSKCGSFFIQAIVGLQGSMFVVSDHLVVLDQPHHHLAVKILSWIEGVIMSILMPHPQGSLDGHK